MSEKPSQDLNEKTISKMTYSQILEANRRQKQGTFMDRTWRDNAENPLEDPNLSKMEKFKSGGYAVRNVIGNFDRNMKIRMREIEFIQDQFDAI